MLTIERYFQDNDDIDVSLAGGGPMGGPSVLHIADDSGVVIDLKCRDAETFKHLGEVISEITTLIGEG